MGFPRTRNEDLAGGFSARCGAKLVYSDPAYRFIISDYVESDIQKNETQASQIFIKTEISSITEPATGIWI